MSYSITGIQQVGIGVDNMEEAWKWYRKQFGMDVPVFIDDGVAELMGRYTNDKPQRRVAVLASSIHGGGCFEVWQFRERTPAPPAFEVKLGDLGVNAVVVKSRDIDASYALHSSQNLDVGSALSTLPDGTRSYSIKDPYGNIFFVEESDEVFRKTNHSAGGVKGVVIGTSDIDAARKLYGDVLGYTDVVFDETSTPDLFDHLPGGEDTFRRVRLIQGNRRRGGFSRLFGTSFVDLIQVSDRKPKKIFDRRLWGDKGYIHVCFDVHDTDDLKKVSDEAGFPFTVDSGAFDMGEATGRFAYTEDPDGTLVELVEAYKMPLLKKIGWYLDLTKRDPQKPVPDWMLKTLRFSRVRDRD